MKVDSVDILLKQWHEQRPDLDPWPTSIAGRVFRLSVHLRRHAEGWLASMGLSWEVFEILMALRRNGAPYEMKPTALYKAALLTSGAMTNRLDRAEEAGLLARQSDPEDRRGVLVRLTPEGLALADKAVERYFEESSQLMGFLSSRDRGDLAAMLGKLLVALEGSEEVDVQQESAPSKQRPMAGSGAKSRRKAARR